MVLQFASKQATIEEIEVIMQTTLTIPEKKANSFLDAPRHISHGEILPSDAPCYQPATNEEEFDEDEEISEEKFYEGLKRAIHDVNEAIAGRKQLGTIEELLAELRS